MAEEIAIDKQLFHDRLSSFTTQWKADKRAGDALFNGAGSIVVCVGKANEGHYTKSAALQVRDGYRERANYGALTFA